MSQITFLAFNPKLKHHFTNINREWITQMFRLEPIDVQVLENPEEYIIQKGGYIWFAEHASLGIIGTCALMKSSEGDFELTKMGVSNSARGLKVGEQLLQYVLAQAQAQPNIKRLYLLTNTACEAAIHLYEKNGFVHDVGIMEEFGSHYERCNVAMLYTNL
ncbi:GNAT family N-acetyltransferase [Glaciecola sp. 1036]|uniref:GNAT family N-acetyltransferase n=1 Tax=Alteromonadaceae TaxID=72275 RepID=UPI003D05A36D